jgi:drug/metabolite transporter (DMT)-like permease
MLVPRPGTPSKWLTALLALLGIIIVFAGFSLGIGAPEHLLSAFLWIAGGVYSIGWFARRIDPRWTPVRGFLVLLVGLFVGVYLLDSKGPDPSARAADAAVSNLPSSSSSTSSSFARNEA